VRGKKTFVGPIIGNKTRFFACHKLLHFHHYFSTKEVGKSRLTIANALAKACQLGLINNGFVPCCSLACQFKL